jgi:hypothetical protein
VILDGCTCHGSDFFLDESTHTGVRPPFPPANSSDETQPLDLGIFALEKAEAAQTKPCPAQNPETRQIVKALNGYQKACCPDNITSAVRRAGIVTDWSSEHQILEAANVRSWEIVEKFEQEHEG